MQINITSGYKQKAFCSYTLAVSIQAYCDTKSLYITVNPLRRVYIKKKNGKERPLGIPTMKDRAMQALSLSARGLTLSETKTKQLIGKHWGSPTVILIRRLNSVITRWTNYHKHIVAGRYFCDLDRFIWFYLWKWAKCRHAKKRHHWIADNYFKMVGNRKWNFFGTFDKGKEILLKHASDTLIKRHVLINGKANPYGALWDKYYQRRYARRLAA